MSSMRRSMMMVIILMWRKYNYDKARKLPAAEYEAMEKVLAENPLYAKVEVSNF